MKKRNRLLALCLCMIVAVSALSFEVSANSPPDAEFTEISFGLEYAVLLMTLMSLPGIILTIIFEVIVAAAFGFDLRTRMIVCLVNLLSQIVMRALFVCINLLINNYFFSIIAVEFLVYFGEYLVYCKLFRDISIKKRLIFTVAANTVSLLLGMWMNDWLLFVFFTGG